MTTVAFRDGILAADSQGTSADMVVSLAERKIGRFPNGDLYAGIGQCARVDTYTRWLEIPEEERGPRPPLEDNYDTVLVCRRNGRVEVHQSGGWFIERAPFMAFGSGKTAALAAMHMGAGAVEAVRIACRLDIYSGGRVRSLKLDRSTVERTKTKGKSRRKSAKSTQTEEA